MRQPFSGHEDVVVDQDRRGAQGVGLVRRPGAAVGPDSNEIHSIPGIPADRKLVSGIRQVQEVPFPDLERIVAAASEVDPLDAADLVVGEYGEIERMPGAEYRELHVRLWRGRD